MSTIYNSDAACEDIYVTEGDTFNIARTQYKNGVAYDMTGMQLDMDILHYSSRTLYRSLSSANPAPKIIISGTSRLLYDTPLAIGKYIYDLQLFDGTDTFTIAYGKIYVKPQIT